MRHHYLRRHEGLKDIGSWAVGSNDENILVQIMGRGPDCDQERLVMTPKHAIVLGLGLVDSATGAAEEIFNASYISGKATILSADRGPKQERRTTLIFENGVNGTLVEVLMADYDALELAKFLMNEALSKITIPRLEAVGL